MHDFPQALKDWRRTRRLSQLQLASEAAVSPRHVAFLETGRARQSRLGCPGHDTCIRRYLWLFAR